VSEEAPLFFDVKLGGLFPANAKAEEAMREIRGRVSVKISGGKANQRRRSLYWSVAALVVPLLNQAYTMTLDEDDLHDITRDKLKLYDEIRLPSGEVYRKRRSTSNRAMNEAERSAYTTKALELWSTWTGVDVTTLRNEATKAAA
jgi:hypothetical protein